MVSTIKWLWATEHWVMYLPKMTYELSSFFAIDTKVKLIIIKNLKVNTRVLIVYTLENEKKNEEVTE